MTNFNLPVMFWIAKWPKVILFYLDNSNLMTYEDYID